jgi:hypothetical protein
LGIQLRRDRLLAWLTLFPIAMDLPHTAQTRATTPLLSAKKNRVVQTPGRDTEPITRPPATASRP